MSYTPPDQIQGKAADGAAVSGNPVRIGGKDGSGNTQDIITDTDGHIQTDILSITAGSNTIGAINSKTGKTLTHANIDVTGTGDQTLISAGTNKLKLRELFLQSSVAAIGIIKDDTAGTALMTIQFDALSGFSLPLPANMDEVHFQTASAKPLSINLSTSARITGFANYWDEA